MNAKIKILNITNNKLLPKLTTILRKNLKNYVQVGADGRRKVWVRVQSYKKVFNFLRRPIPTIKIKPKYGTIEYSKKNYAFYEFKFKKYNLYDEHSINKFMVFIRKKYNKIINKDKYFNMQRIGVRITTDLRQKKFTTVDGKVKKDLANATISTRFCEREKRSTDEMFDELEQKLLKFFWNGADSELIKSYMKFLDDTEEDIEYIKIFSFFVNYQEQ